MSWRIDPNSEVRLFRDMTSPVGAPVRFADDPAGEGGEAPEGGSPEESIPVHRPDGTLEDVPASAIQHFTVGKQASMSSTEVHRFQQQNALLLRSLSSRLSLFLRSELMLEQISLGNHGAGEMSVRWDGLNLMLDGQIVDLDYSKLNRQEFYVDEAGEQILDEAGNPIQVPYPPGEYSFKISGNTGGATEEFATLMSARVDSVSLSPSGAATLNLAGGKRAAMEEIKQIVNE